MAKVTRLKVKGAWGHQQQSLDFFENVPCGFDFSDPGTGKTFVQVANYDRRFDAGRWLIICPKTLMKSAWGNDIEKFAPRLTVAYAYADNRAEAFAANTNVVIINTDGVKWLVDNLKVLKGFDHLTVDESTAFKHGTSQRTKAMMKVAKQFKYRYLLTGTPTPQSVMELFYPALIVDGGKRLGTSYYKLRAVMQEPEQIGPSPDHLKWSDKPGASQAVDDMLRDITIAHVFEEVMTHVPPNHRNIKFFDLSPKLRKTYDKMETECLVAFDEGQSLVTGVHAASLRQKLLQIASGAVYDSNGAYQLVDTARYEFIADMVEERPHSVVFFNWEHQKEYLAAELTKRKITFDVIDGSVPDKKRDAIVERYQRGELQTLLLHPKTGAHGLTLTRGDTTIFASPVYEGDVALQALRRIYRGGQDKVTNTIFVLAKNTVEETKVYPRLQESEARMKDLQGLQAAHNKK